MYLFNKKLKNERMQRHGTRLSIFHVMSRSVQLSIARSPVLS